MLFRWIHCDGRRFKGWDQQNFDRDGESEIALWRERMERIEDGTESAVVLSMSDNL